MFIDELNHSAAGELREAPGAGTAPLRQRVALYPERLPRSSIMTSTCLIPRTQAALPVHGRGDLRMTRLREQMIHDMTLRGLASNTQRAP